jgi:hypothetical protein
LTHSTKDSIVTSQIAPKLVTGVALLALVLAYPSIYARFPSYASGYLIQIAAIMIGYWYFHHYRLFETYTDWRCKGLLLLAFVIPLQNTFWLKVFRKKFLDSNLILEIFRPEIVLLIVVAIGAASVPRSNAAFNRIPATLKFSFFLGFAAWAVSTSVSANPLLSLATGIFEFLIPFAMLYTFVGIAPDRAYMKHAASLFFISYALVSIALISATFVIPNAELAPVFGFPLFANDFLTIKRDGVFLKMIGGNAYENPDFFISLWVLAVPFLTVSYYQATRKLPVLLVLAVIFYAGLLQYSRAGLVVVVFALLLVIALRYFLLKQWSWLPALLLVFIAFVHIDRSANEYFVGGLSQLIGGLAGRPQTDPRMLHPPQTDPLMLQGSAVEQQDIVQDLAENDHSGTERARALSDAMTIGKQNFWTGIGYGIYPTIHPVPPHSLLLYRLAEGGILGAISILALALYAPWRAVQSLRQRSTDIFQYACLLGLSSFMLKALLFSSSFSLVGIVVWGFGFAMILAATVVGDKQEAEHAMPNV